MDIVSRAEYVGSAHLLRVGEQLFQLCTILVLLYIFIFMLPTLK